MKKSLSLAQSRKKLYILHQQKKTVREAGLGSQQTFIDSGVSITNVKKSTTFPSQRVRGVSMTDNYAEYLQMDLDNFTGEWVAIEAGEIIAHDKNFKIVFTDARKKLKNKMPFIVRVPEHATMIF